MPADAHHIHVGPDDTVYLVDRDAHQVLLYDTAGNPLGAIGEQGPGGYAGPVQSPG